MLFGPSHTQVESITSSSWMMFVRRGSSAAVSTDPGTLHTEKSHSTIYFG